MFSWNWLPPTESTCPFTYIRLCSSNSVFSKADTNVLSRFKMAAAVTFRGLFDNPPSGNVRDGHATTRSTAPLNHVLSQDAIPNEIVDAPELPDNLISWAQAYLSQIGRVPGQELVSMRPLVSHQLDRSNAGNEGTIGSIYHRNVEFWSSEFVADADNVSSQQIQFEECEQVLGVRTDWKWVREDGTRMLVELKARLIFDRHCDQIRTLALQRTALGVSNHGSAEGARSILLKVSHQQKDFLLPKC